MAQKITFTFNSIGVVGDLTTNFKFNNGSNYFNEDIIFTNFLVVDPHRVHCGADTTEFATNFKNILLGLMHPNGNIPFYNKVTQIANVVEVILGSTTTTDTFLLNDITTDVGSMGSFLSYNRTIHDSSNLLISWGGATDDKNAIVGYEITYRANNSSFWQGPIFTGSTYSGGLYEITIPSSSNIDYSIRVRTKDDVGQYSDYKIISNSVPYRRSSTFENSQDSCGLSTTIPVYIDTTLPSNGTAIAYTDSILTTPFDGSDKYWAISDTNGIKFSVKIAVDGVISDSFSCAEPPSGAFRSRYKISSTVTSTSFTPVSGMCNVISDVPVYYPNPLIGVGMTLYNDVSLLTPFTYVSSTNDYYLVDNFYTLQIDRTNGKVLKMSFRSSFCSTTTSGGGSGGCCLLKGSKILLSNNTIKNIEDVNIGDIVISYDFENSKKSESIVTKTFSPLKNDIIKILLSNDNCIDCTTSHPIWSNNRNEWVSYNPEITKKYMGLDTLKLNDNDIFVDIDGNEVSILEIIVVSSDFINTYDISVEPFNNYYANNILVHNKILPEDPLNDNPNQF